MTIFALLLTASAGAAVLLDLFIMLMAAKLMAELFERLRQPAVAGEILAGILIGPSLLGLNLLLLMLMLLLLLMLMLLPLFAGLLSFFPGRLLSFLAEAG